MPVDEPRMTKEDAAEIKSGVRLLQLDVAHLNEAVARHDSRFDTVDRSVADLAQGQRRIERKLTEHDRRFEEHDRRFDRVDARFDQVDARFDQVDARFEQIDARFEQVDARFEQVDARFEQVDARFDRVERSLQEIQEGLRETRREIGALTQAYGIDLEDIGRHIVPIYLRHIESFEVGELETVFVRIGDEEFEIDLFGDANRGGQVYTVVGEVRSRVHPGEMEELLERNRRIASGLDRAVLQVLMARRIHPRALEIARAAGVVVVPWNYQYDLR